MSFMCMSKRVIMYAFKEDRHEMEEEDAEGEVYWQVGGLADMESTPSPSRSMHRNQYSMAVGCRLSCGQWLTTRNRHRSYTMEQVCHFGLEAGFSINPRNVYNPKQEFWILKVCVEML